MGSATSWNTAAHVLGKSDKFIAVFWVRRGAREEKDRQKREGKRGLGETKRGAEAAEDRTTR